MADMNTTTDRALGWDDEFTNVSQDFVLLPEGEYYFEVTGMERARFDALISGVLRQGHKMLLAGPSKAGNGQTADLLLSQTGALQQIPVIGTVSLYEA